MYLFILSRLTYTPAKHLLHVMYDVLHLNLLIDQIGQYDIVLQEQSHIAYWLQGVVQQGLPCLSLSLACQAGLVEEPASKVRAWSAQSHI